MTDADCNMVIGPRARPSKLRHAISALTSRKWKRNWMNFRRKKERNNEENIRLEICDLLDRGWRSIFYGERKIIYLGHKCASVIVMIFEQGVWFPYNVNLQERSRFKLKSAFPIAKLLTYFILIYDIQPCCQLLKNIPQTL